LVNSANQELAQIQAFHNAEDDYLDAKEDLKEKKRIYTKKIQSDIFHKNLPDPIGFLSDSHRSEFDGTR
jgi:hypothetical protein